MAYAFVQEKGFSENRSTASAATFATGAFGASLTAGNLLIARVAYTANPDLGAVTITLSGASTPTWNAETVFTDGAANYVHDFYAMNIPGGATTQLTATPSGAGSGFVTFPAIMAAEYSGFDTAAARLAYISSSQATPTTGTDLVTSGLLGTLSSQPAGIVAVSFNTAGVNVPSAGTSFTSRATDWTYQGATPVVMRLEDRRVTATTSVAGTFTAVSNTLHQTAAWAFKEAASGAAVSGPSPRCIFVMP